MKPCESEGAGRTGGVGLSRPADDEWHCGWAFGGALEAIKHVLACWPVSFGQAKGRIVASSAAVVAFGMAKLALSRRKVAKEIQRASLDTGACCG